MRFFLLTFLLFPISTNAAVVISEVAWMGSASSANHEWIELYNDGVAVDVSGWTLTDGMNLSIPLAGIIPAQSYAVLERTSDASAVGSAFLIYSGSLVNIGATLQLKRSDGGLEDQVAGGENWQSIGGDNLTKETAQYTTTGWVTGAATPGMINSGAPKKNDATEENDNESTQPSNSKISSDEAVKLVLPGMTLKLAVTAQKLGYVHQSIDFAGTPSGVGDTLIDSLSYEWNFGDGTTAVAKEPIHSYKFPGTYVVTVYGGYKRQEQVARHEITILPVALSLTTSPRGDLQVHNESPYEIDISGYRVDGGKRFVFPARSVMLPNQTVTLEANKIGVANRAVIRDAAGVIVLSKDKPSKADTPTTATVPQRQTAVKAIEQKEEAETALAWHAPLLPPAFDTLGTTLKSYLTPHTAEAAIGSVSTSSKQSRISENAWPYLGLIGVIILGLFGTARKVLGNQTE